MYQCRYLALHILAGPPLGQIELQSFIVLYGVKTDKNESRILRGQMPAHIHTRASKRGLRPFNCPM